MTRIGECERCAHCASSSPTGEVAGQTTTRGRVYALRELSTRFPIVWLSGSQPGFGGPLWGWIRRSGSVSGGGLAERPKAHDWKSCWV